MDRRVPHSALAAAICAAGLEHVWVRDLARHPALYRAGELAPVSQFPDWDFVPAGGAEGFGRSAIAPAARDLTVRRDEKSFRPDRNRVRSLPEGHGGRGPEVRHHIQPYARR